mgnify:CR=1 FL=1
MSWYVFISNCISLDGSSSYVYLCMVAIRNRCSHWLSTIPYTMMAVHQWANGKWKKQSLENQMKGLSLLPINSAMHQWAAMHNCITVYKRIHDAIKLMETLSLSYSQPSSWCKDAGQVGIKGWLTDHALSVDEEWVQRMVEWCLDYIKSSRGSWVRLRMTSWSRQRRSKEIKVCIARIIFIYSFLWVSSSWFFHLKNLSRDFWNEC